MRRPTKPAAPFRGGRRKKRRGGFQHKDNANKDSASKNGASKNNKEDDDADDAAEVDDKSIDDDETKTSQDWVKSKEEEEERVEKPTAKARKKEGKTSTDTVSCRYVAAFNAVKLIGLST